jgi:urease accessory protein
VTTDLEEAPELDAYHGEPAQLPSGSPGKNGYLRLGFGVRGGRTELTDLYRVTPLLVQQALHWDEGMPDMACVFLVSTSGGVLQGDRQAMDITVEAGARAHITSQSATKIQEMDANFATMDQRIVLSEGSYLEYLPDPIIPYRGSRFVGRTRVTIPAGATLLYSEILLPGRKHYRADDLFAYDLLSTSFEAARPDGTPLFAEKFVIEPKAFPLDNIAVMNGYHVLANVFVLTTPEHAEAILATVAPAVDRDAEIAEGAGRLPNDAGLVYKVLGMETEPVRARVRAFWSAVRAEIVQSPVPTAFRWR